VFPERVFRLIYYFKVRLIAFPYNGVLEALLGQPEKNLFGDKRSSLSCPNVSDEEKKVYNIDSRTMRSSKRSRLSLPTRLADKTSRLRQSRLLQVKRRESGAGLVHG